MLRIICSVIQSNTINPIHTGTGVLYRNVVHSIDFKPLIIIIRVNIFKFPIG